MISKVSHVDEFTSLGKMIIEDRTEIIIEDRAVLQRSSRDKYWNT